jgi:hypothetical protein
VLDLLSAAVFYEIAMSHFEDLATTLLPKPNVKLLCLTKIGLREHLLGLQQGHLRCRHLSFYKRIEGSPLHFQDPDEGLLGIYQAGLVELSFTPPDHAPIVMNSGNGLLGQVIITTDLDNPIFCMHAIHTGDWTHRTFGAEELAAFKESLQIPAEMDRFGTHILVITNGLEFLRRVRRACVSQQIRLSCGLVRYVEPSRVHGPVPKHLSTFTKRTCFKHEREYRFQLTRLLGFPDPFALEVGPLEDISIVAPLNEFRQQWRVSFPSDNQPPSEKSLTT